MFDITKLTSELNKLGGAAQTNYFAVSIPNPKKLAGQNVYTTLQTLCEATTLPGIAIGTDDKSLPYGYGPVFKMPWGVVFTDINLVFIGDNKGVIHNHFMGWVDSIVHFNAQNTIGKSNRGYPFLVSYKEDYTVDMQIFAYSPDFKRIVEYTLYDAFPTVVDEIQGAWSQQNQFMRIGVKINFSRWTATWTKLNKGEVEVLRQVGDVSPIDLVSVENMTVTPRTAPVINAYKGAIPFLSDTDFNT